MPIIGVTDSVRPAFPNIGKLRKGAARPAKGNAPGKDLDFFRFTSDNPAVVKAFVETYGTEPREIPCYLPYAGVEDNFATWKEAWVAGGLQHRCDGVTCVIWLTDKGTYSREPIPCPGGCDQVGRLNLILPELVSAGFVGYVTVETHSINDILNLQASLEAAAQLAPSGDLRGIMWSLRRVPEKISTPTQNGGRARYEKWMLKLTPDPAWARKQLAGGDPAPVRALAAGVDVDTGEIVDSDWEFADAEEVEEPAVGSGVAEAIITKVQQLITERRSRTSQDGGMKWDQVLASEKQCQYLASILQQALNSKTPNERYAIYELLTGKPDSSEMTMAEAAGLISWLIEEVDGQKVLREEAPSEAAILYREAMRRQGQGTLL